MENLNLIDIIILMIFFSSIAVGFARGLASEFISLATLIAAFVVAITFTSTLANALTNTGFVQKIISQTTTASGMSTSQPASYALLALSFGLLFAATILVGAFVKSLLNIALQTGMVGIGNRLLGGVFGFVRGFLLNLVLIFIVQLTPLQSESWWQDSSLVGKFQPAVQWLGQIVSPLLSNIENRVGSALQDVGSQIQNFGG